MQHRRRRQVPRLLSALAAGAIALTGPAAGLAAAHPGHDHGSDSGSDSGGDNGASAGGAKAGGNAGGGASSNGRTGSGSDRPGGSKSLCTDDAGRSSTAACDTAGR